MKVDTEEIYYIARLARLHLTDEEANTVSKKLSEILEYMTKLESLNFDSDFPTSQENMSENIFREDELFRRISHAEALRQSPDLDTNYFRVPKVIS